MRAQLLTLALGILAVAPAAADWRDAHKLGVEAVEAGRWADAERFFRAALGERSEERVNRLTKAAYIPHYFLGVALAEQGDCRGALQSWQESERQGVVQRSKQAKDLGRRQEQCQSYLRQADAASKEVEQVLSTVAAASESLHTLSRTPELSPLWAQGNPSFGARQLAAAQKLENARQRHREGAAESDLEKLDDARTLAQEALSEFEATVKAARRKLGELNAATASALETLEKAEESARRVLRSITDLAPYPRRLGARVSAVEGMLRTIEDSKSGAGANRLEALTDELTVALAAVRRAARRPPEKLARAAEAFFGGRFEEALELTAEESLAKDPRARSHVCLLRAAARHALYVLSGEQDETLLQLASQELDPCREIDPPLPPQPKYFSPLFIAFYESSLALPAAEDDATDPAETEADLEESR